MTPLKDWPMNALVMCVGMLLALATGARIIAAPWEHPWAPPESWLLFITGLITITFTVKRATYKDLWRKSPTAATSTTTSTTTTKGPEPPAQ